MTLMMVPSFIWNLMVKVVGGALDDMVLFVWNLTTP